MVSNVINNLDKEYLSSREVNAKQNGIVKLNTYLDFSGVRVQVKLTKLHPKN